MSAYTALAGTSYTAAIETPSGLTFHAEIYVPPEAEHDDQHELAEIAQYGASKMLGAHLRGEEYRERARHEDQAEGPVGACFELAPSVIPNAVRETCCLPAGHAGGHRSDSGMEWSLLVTAPPEPDPF